MNTRKRAIAGALLLSSLLAASSALAGPQVHWQVTVESPAIRLPGHVVLPLPPILVPRMVVTDPHLRHHRGYREPSRWDVDGDGVPNRHDRVYNPRWDRDGDGTPNRYDPRPNDPRSARGPSRHEERRDWRDDRHGR